MLQGGPDVERHCRAVIEQEREADTITAEAGIVDPQVILGTLVGAITPFLATWLGVPVSTTHTIVGIGAARRASAVRWGVAGNIVIAWVVTLPAAAAISAICYGLIMLLVP